MSCPETSTWREERLHADAADLPVRVYRSASAGRSAPLVFHLHGGAFIGGSLECGEMVSQLLAQAGAVVVSVDYPLAPDHPFPQALNLSFSALTTLHKERARFAGRNSRLFVAGEEAGANIAAALALMARDQQIPPLAGQILLSPMLDPCLATKSIRAAEAGPVGCKWADGWQRYLGTADKAAHPYAAPLGSRRLASLPPALVITAEDDPMRDESLAYAERMRASGVEVQDRVLPSPTQWPDALGQCASMPAEWTGAVSELFAAFMANPSVSGGATHSIRTIRA